MPDLPTVGGGPSTTGSNPAASSGITITANASANTKATTWTELIASTGYAGNWVLVTLQNASVAGAATGYFVDIGVGASTAEQVLIPNLHANEVTAINAKGRNYLLPVRVAQGTRISARCQATTGAGTIRVAVTVIGGAIDAPPGLTRVEMFAGNTGTTRGTKIDAGAVAHTDVVGQLIAATAHHYKWMCLSIFNADDATTAADTSFLIDIMTGAGGSEVSVVDDLYVLGTATLDAPSPPSVCFPCAIAAGARVAGRVRCGITTANDRVIELVGYGVG